MSHTIIKGLQCRYEGVIRVGDRGYKHDREKPVRFSGFVFFSSEKPTLKNRFPVIGSQRCCVPGMKQLDDEFIFMSV